MDNNSFCQIAHGLGNIIFNGFWAEKRQRGKERREGIKTFCKRGTTTLMSESSLATFTTTSPLSAMAEREQGQKQTNGKQRRNALPCQTQRRLCFDFCPSTTTEEDLRKQRQFMGTQKC